MLNPDPHNLPKLDPKDEFLLEDASGAAGPFINGGSRTPGSSQPQSKSVTWLRKTEYISRVDVTRAAPSQEPYATVQHAPCSNTDTLAVKTWSPSSTFPAQPKSAISKHHSQPHRTTNSISAPCGTPINQTSQLLNHLRYSPTLRFGPTRTICSGSQNGLASGLLRYVSWSFVFDLKLTRNTGG